MIDLREIIRKEVQDRAYDRYEFRIENGIPGTAEEDWFAAEKEILVWHNPNRDEWE